MSDESEIENGTGDGGLDEERAQAVAEELVELQQSSSGNLTKRKQSRAALLEWMLENEREAITVGRGTAEVHYSAQPIKPHDLLEITLRDEPYNWDEKKIDELIETMEAIKENIAEPKPVLRIRINKKGAKGAKKRKRPREDQSDNQPYDQTDADGEANKEDGRPVRDVPLRVPTVPWAPAPAPDQKHAETHNIDKENAERENAKKGQKIAGVDVEVEVEMKGSTLPRGDDDDPQLLWKKEALPVYAKEMDTEDIAAGRSRPPPSIADALGPINK